MCTRTNYCAYAPSLFAANRRHASVVTAHLPRFSDSLWTGVLSRRTRCPLVPARQIQQTRLRFTPQLLAIRLVEAKRVETVTVMQT